MNPPVIPLPQLLSERQAAAYLTLSIATLRRLREAREISYIQLTPRVIRYSQRHLAEYTGHAVPRESALLTREVIARSAVPRSQMTCGIYFLLQRERIVYVGQSRNVPARIHEHHTASAMAFDRYWLQQCPARLLSRLEAHYISVFQPRYNISIPFNEGLSEDDLTELARAQT